MAKGNNISSKQEQMTHFRVCGWADGGNLRESDIQAKD